MKIAIIGPQGLPVPAIKGGAIETLIDVITKENEKEKKLNQKDFSIMITVLINSFYNGLYDNKIFK